MSEVRGLRLRAEDDEDLAVIAACLHGAIGSLGEMAYDREARRFAAILVRQLWDAGAVDTLENAGALERMRAGLHFDDVAAVRYRRLDRTQPQTLLHLVSIVSAPISERFGIVLSFECGGEVFLEVDRLSGHLQDLEMKKQNKERPA